MCQVLNAVNIRQIFDAIGVGLLLRRPGATGGVHRQLDIERRTDHTVSLAHAPRPLVVILG